MDLLRHLGQMLSLRQQAKSDLRCYISEEIPYVWDQIAPLIEIALDSSVNSNYSLADILEGLCNKSMQLWVYRDFKAVMITTIGVISGVKHLRYLTMGGEGMATWIKYLPLVEEWAKDEGCEEAKIYGRIGWAKMTGYEIEYTKMTKRL